MLAVITSALATLIAFIAAEPAISAFVRVRRHGVIRIYEPITFDRRLRRRTRNFSFSKLPFSRHIDCLIDVAEISSSLL